MHPLRDKAINLRKEGKSYRDIEAELGINRSTLSYMLKDVILSDAQVKRLQEKKIKCQEKFVKYLKSEPLEEKIARGKRGGRSCWERHSEKMRDNLRSGFALSLVTYRQDELPVKEKLEAIYGTTFHKEVISGQAVDFVSDEFLIEHSIDGSRGLQELTVRFQKLAKDPRRKIAYVETKNLGKLRRARLSMVVDEIHDFRTLA